MMVDADLFRLDDDETLELFSRKGNVYCHRFNLQSFGKNAEFLV